MSIDLSANCAGIKSPNPFWLSSAPPTDKKYNVERAFKAGWGGVVWKTLGEDPPIVNTCSRYGSLNVGTQKMLGFNNIELISDRPLDVNLREIKETKREWKDRAVVVSLMVPCEEQSWKNILKKVEDTEADGISLINTINSIVCVDLDLLAPTPTVAGKGTHGGYCGPAVKPIALHMVAEISRDSETRVIPISGIGGVSNWRDAAEFLALGSRNVQVCTAAMHYGFTIVDEMIEGLTEWMASKGYTRLDDFIGKAIPNMTDWQNLDLNFKTIAHIDDSKCIGCGLCYIACEDTAHQAISVHDCADHRHHPYPDLQRKLHLVEELMLLVV